MLSALSEMGEKNHFMKYFNPLSTYQFNRTTYFCSLSLSFLANHLVLLVCVLLENNSFLLELICKMQLIEIEIDEIVTKHDFILIYLYELPDAFIFYVDHLHEEYGTFQE